MTGGESRWRPFGRFLKYLAVSYLAGLAMVLVILWLRDSFTAHAMAMAFYAAGSVIAAGYVGVMLGIKINSGMGVPFVSPSWYLGIPLDEDFAGSSRRADDIQEVAALIFALLALFWGGGVLLEMYT